MYGPEAGIIEAPTPFPYPSDRDIPPRGTVGVHIGVDEEAHIYAKGKLRVGVQVNIASSDGDSPLEYEPSAHAPKAIYSERASPPRPNRSKMPHDGSALSSPSHAGPSRGGAPPAAAPFNNHSSIHSPQHHVTHSGPRTSFAGFSPSQRIGNSEWLNDGWHTPRSAHAGQFEHSRSPPAPRTPQWYGPIPEEWMPQNNNVGQEIFYTPLRQEFSPTKMPSPSASNSGHPTMLVMSPNSHRHAPSGGGVQSPPGKRDHNTNVDSRASTPESLASTFATIRGNQNQNPAQKPKGAQDNSGKIGTDALTAARKERTERIYENTHTSFDEIAIQAQIANLVHRVSGDGTRVNHTQRKTPHFHAPGSPFGPQSVPSASCRGIDLVSSCSSEIGSLRGSRGESIANENHKISSIETSDTQHQKSPEGEHTHGVGDGSGTYARTRLGYGGYTPSVMSANRTHGSASSVGSVIDDINRSKAPKRGQSPHQESERKSQRTEGVPQHSTSTQQRGNHQSRNVRVRGRAEEDTLEAPTSPKPRRRHEGPPTPVVDVVEEWDAQMPLCVRPAVVSEAAWRHLRSPRAVERRFHEYFKHKNAVSPRGSRRKHVGFAEGDEEEADDQVAPVRPNYDNEAAVLRVLRNLHTRTHMKYEKQMTSGGSGVTYTPPREGVENIREE